MAEVKGTESHVPIGMLNDQFGRLLDWQLAGEEAIRLYRMDYTILRTTGLELEDAEGMCRLKFEQGDFLAALCTAQLCRGSQVTIESWKEMAGGGGGYRGGRGGAWLGN